MACWWSTGAPACAPPIPRLAHCWLPVAWPDPAPFPLHSNDAWSTLQAAVERAFEQGSWPESSREVRLMFDDGQSRTLQVRARFTRRRPLDSDGAPPEEFCVVFLEDLRSVQSRSRQEKLAAMGRVSAGIAHEIRNPLAAIAQANALLLEDVLSNEQHYLARMVADNVDRLKRIVDDVMEASPGAAGEQRVLDASAVAPRSAPTGRARCSWRSARAAACSSSCPTSRSR